MKRKRSLRQVLARQWTAFAVVLFAGFAAMAVLLLYMLEDSFIDRRLESWGGQVASLTVPPVLPPRVQLLDRATVTGALLEETRDQGSGAIREFRLPDGRYVHVLAGTGRGGADFLLVYDVTDQLEVNAALAQGWPWLLLMGMVLATCAYALGSRFVARVSHQARHLVAQAGRVEGSAGLRDLAEHETIQEFSELASISADAWEAHMAALERERETLAFLAHELRTPLQSARTSLALLQDDRGNGAAWARLGRAVDRLVRASHGVLWLSTDDVPAPEGTCRVHPILDELAGDLVPLAASRQQSLNIRMNADMEWTLPAEVIETVLANLLLNAIQHGGAGTIEIEMSGHSLTISNPSGDGGSAGFGLGLQVVRRLLQRFGWSVEQLPVPGRVALRVGLDAPAG